MSVDDVRDEAEVAKSSKSPAFQFYSKDFLSSSKVSRMSLTERGAYITLLSHCWLDAGLPTDMGALARLVGLRRQQFERMWHNGPLCECFYEKAGKLQNPRLDVERKAQADHRRKQAANGIKGGRPKKAVGSFGFPETEPKKSSASASASPSASTEERETPARDGQAMFMQLVAAYPPERVTSGRPTQDAFLKALGPPPEWPERFALMLATLELHKASEQWRNPRFAPNLERWLERGDWRGTRKLELAGTGTDGRGRTGVAKGQFDGLEEQD